MLPRMRAQSKSADELRGIAAEFMNGLTRGSAATVVTLSGDLGAGKTTFAQGVAKALGVEEAVTSPTFVIEKVYALTGQKFERLIHIDAYRIKATREMEVLGWKDVLDDPRNLVLIEWPEKIADLIPESSINLRFDIDGDGRMISSTYER